MLITDLDTDRPQWRLTSYGPSGAGNLVEGKDVSPEELRMRMLESNGNQQAYVRMMPLSPAASVRADGALFSMNRCRWRMSCSLRRTLSSRSVGSARISICIAV
jgi:hypothetical protein